MPGDASFQSSDSCHKLSTSSSKSKVRFLVGFFIFLSDSGSSNGCSNSGIFCFAVFDICFSFFESRRVCFSNSLSDVGLLPGSRGLMKKSDEPSLRSVLVFLLLWDISGEHFRKSLSHGHSDMRPLFGCIRVPREETYAKSGGGLPHFSR